MAFTTGVIFESRTTGSDTLCSGGFSPISAGFATDGAATSATGNSPVFSSASYNFVAGDIGAKIFIQTGTNWVKGWYEIQSVASNNATIKAAIGEANLYGGFYYSTNGTLSFTPNTTAGCATTASPTGATWGIDYSQQDTAKIAFTDMIIAVTTTQFTSAANPVGKNFVGNLIKITSGVNFTVQTVEVLSTSGTTATCDKSLGTAAAVGGNGYLGGCFAGPQLAAPLIPGNNGNRVWVKNGAYTINNTTANIAQGRISFATGSYIIEGYNSYRGDGGTAPVFTASGISNNTILTMANSSKIKNINVDGASLTGMTGITGATSEVVSCKASNCLTSGFIGGKNYLNVADTCGTGFALSNSNAGTSTFCVAKSCTTGFNSSAQCSITNSIATGCTTSFDSSSITRYINCTAYSGTTGFKSSSGSQCEYIKCIASNMSGNGYDLNTGRADFYQCAGYSNGTSVNYGQSSAMYASSNYNFVTLSASPFTNAAGGDFSLNATTGGGAEIRNLIITFPTTISTTTYNDAGAAEHLENLTGTFTFG